MNRCMPRRSKSTSEVSPAVPCCRAAVLPPGVVEHLDVVEDVGAGIIARGVDLPADTLAFERLEEAFGHCVVMEVATPTRAAAQVVIARKRLPLMGGEQAALVRVRRDDLLWLAPP